MTHTASGPTTRGPGRSSRSRQCLAGVVAIVAVATLTPAGASSAAPTDAPKMDRHPTTVTVRGRQIPIIADQGVYRMRGDLIGRWTTLTADTLPGYSIPEAPWELVQTGQEQFRGCVDRNRTARCDSSDPSGQLRFDYLAWSTYDRHTGRLIEGNCVHAITSGSGDFSGARGIVTMHDHPVGRDGVLTTYEGQIVLNALPFEQHSSPQGTSAPRPAAPTTRAAE
jgi:hypothetical protein